VEEVVKVVAKALLLIGVLAAPSIGSAQEYPTKPVTIVIPFTAGGSNDIIGRYLADGLRRIWKQTVIVENRPGAGSAIGSAHVAKSARDGHTLLLVSGTFTTNAATQDNLPFDPVKDLQPIGMVALGDRVIVTGSRIPIKTVADLVNQAKAQTVFYGTTGVGSSTQFDTEFLSDVLGVKMKPVHYKGGTDALIDLAGGRIDVYVGSVTQVMSNVANGTANPVAVMSKNRAKALPNAPTIVEAGFPDAETYIWWGIFAPAGISPAIAGKINRGISEVMTAPDAAEFLERNGLLVPHNLSVPQFTSHVASEIERWKELVSKNDVFKEMN
jgi:tripartite-type tricarboxylate transporter receptor subunit TctC